MGEFMRNRIWLTVSGLAFAATIGAQSASAQATKTPAKKAAADTAKKSASKSAPASSNASAVATKTASQPAAKSSAKSPAATKSPGVTKTAKKDGSAGGTRPADASGKCKDGSFTKAATKQGACSRHGGVAEWYKG